MQNFSITLILCGYLLTISSAIAQPVLNEIMATNLNILTDEDGSFEDWIEIYNPGSDTISLEGYGLSDNPEQPFKWVFPDYVIYPNEHLIIWASGKDRRPSRHGYIQGLSRAVWFNVPGGNIQDLLNYPNYPDQPSVRHVIKQFFEAPRNIADQYGQEIQGWLIPPVTGTYTFWISGDDQSQLFLSKDEDHTNATLIAQVPGWTNPREWDKYVQQKSVSISLEAGQRYFIRALMKEGFGGDNLAVRWQFPDGTIEDPLELRHCSLPGSTLHTNFRISGDGETIVLTSPNGALVDSIPSRPLPRNVSFGRLPNGSGSFVLFDHPTPGSINHTEGFTERLATPILHLPAGIYPDSVLVSISAQDSEDMIWYTIDGSMPIPGQAALYQIPFSHKLSATVRAVAARQGYLTSEPTAATYVITASSLKDFSSNLPLMIINQFDTLIAASDKSISYMTLIDEKETGRYRLDHTAPFNARINIEIRGSSSQWFPKNGFGFHILSEDGSNRKEELLGMPAEHNWVLHGPYSDKSLMRNALAYELAREMGDYAPRTHFVELFLHEGNGALNQSHYHGVYLLVERIKIAPGRLELEELENHHSQEPEVSGGYIFKKDRLGQGESGMTLPRGNSYAFVRPQEENITLEQRDWLRDWLTQVDEAIMGPDFLNPQLGYRSFLDVATFIDYHLHTELHKQIDGYRLSTFFHKDRNGKLRLGPIWDYNLSWGNADYHNGWTTEGWYYNEISQYEYLNGWFTRMFEDPIFEREYKQRFRELRQNIFSEDHLIGKLREKELLLEEAAVRNFQRWPIMGVWVWPNWHVATTYGQEIDWMEEWMRNRLAWMDSQLRDSIEVVHYWNFNDANLLMPSYTYQGAKLTINEAPGAEVLSGNGQGFNGENARFGDAVGNHLRINNPVGSVLDIQLPAKSFSDLVFAYETRRSGSGANRQYLSYTLNGIDFQPLDTLIVTEVPTLYNWELSDTIGVNNNPSFAIRIVIDQVDDGSGGMVGNNRFDNFTLDGIFMEGGNLPPVVIENPGFQELIALDGTLELDLADLFEDPDGDTLVYSASLDFTNLGELSWNGSILKVRGLSQGEVRITLSVEDGQNLPTILEVPILIYPTAHDLNLQPFHFDHWSADEQERTYPDNMLFLQCDHNDPLLGDTLRHAYYIPHADYAAGDVGNIGFPYRNESRTRLNGLGEEGISFINTGRGRDLGAALVNLSTQGLDTVLVRWTGGTLRSNSRVYNLRTQYRLGLDGSWKDVKNDTGIPLEYQRSDMEGHEQEFKWIPLPNEVLNQPNLLLQWKYYFTGEQLDPGSGARDMLRLDDIEIVRERTSSLTHLNIQETLKLFPSPVQSGQVYFNRITSGRIMDLTGRELLLIRDAFSMDVSICPPGLYVYWSENGEALRFVVH